MAELVVFHKNRKIFSFPLDRGNIKIGRSDDCDLVLSGESVSRTHVLLKQCESCITIEDVSSHGTLINGNKLNSTKPLKERDQIRVGDWELIYQAAKFSKSLAQNTQPGLRTSNTQILPTKQRQEKRPSTAVIVIEDAGGSTSRQILTHRALCVGSGPRCDIVLNDTFVSREHLRLSLAPGGVLIEDLGSTNGTELDGVQIRSSVRAGEFCLKIGNSRLLLRCQKEENDTTAEIALSHLVGKTSALKDVHQAVRRAAATEATALVLGETGTGKELVAQAIHALSSRQDKNFVAINCAAITATLVESELFGHEKGAFTGADQKRIGAFEQAQGGTLFLDEIGELPLDLQAKLLRVLEVGTYRRVGGNIDLRADVRIIAATHRDLSALSSDGKFREDLFYRLFVLPIRLPPLRKRLDDIPLLVDSFLKIFGQSSDCYESDFIETLLTHDWPGNVRELKNTVMRALILADGSRIKAEHIKLITKPNRVGPTLLKPYRAPDNPETERELLRSAIATAGGDKSRAAKTLGMGRSTLFRKLKDLEI